MVFAIMRLFPLMKDRAKLLEILESVQHLSVLRRGCLGSWLSVDHLRHNHICYGEQWAEEEDLYAHMRSDLYRRVLAAIELSHTFPEVNFHFVAATKGMELIQALRGQSDAGSMGGAQ
jgi:quinol monooxygenase YgiN